MGLLELTIGWLAPPQCVGCGAEGQALCETCITSGILPFGERCWRCDGLSPGCRTCPKCRFPGLPRFVWINCSYEGLAGEVLRLYKFGHQRAAAEPIARLMVSTFLSFQKPSGPEFRDKNYLLVPVSTATSRTRERSFGHAELLAGKIAAKLKSDKSNLLVRLGQARQLGARREDRLTQLAGSFIVKNPRCVAGRHILLIDDVITTGGTLMAATKALRAAGASRVDALVFAKRL